MKKIIIYVKGTDRTGIVSDISKEITNLNGNIEISKMIKLGHEFNMLILAAIEYKNIKKLESSLSQYSKLKIAIDSMDEKEVVSNEYYLFTLKGADNEGVIYAYTKLFSALHINIIDMETELRNAPITGLPLLFIKSKISIPNNINIKNLTMDLIDLSEKTNVAIKLKKFIDEN